MRTRNTLRQMGSVSLVAAALALATSAQAQGYGMGPGMMHGYGPGSGMMGPGYGMMGPGGYGMGPGMMGGYGDYETGPGMMGPGYGMMGPGGYGMGPGMMGGYGLGQISGLDLSDQQRDQITKLRDQLRRQHWGIMGKIMDERSKLSDLYAEDKPDAGKIGAVYGDIAKLQKEMVQTRVDSWNKIQDVLTPQQREQLKAWRQGRWGTGGGQPQTQYQGGTR
jgi:Spy/CpxP family protein refolding chaperone